MQTVPPCLKLGTRVFSGPPKLTINRRHSEVPHCAVEYMQYAGHLAVPSITQLNTRHSGPLHHHTTYVPQRTPPLQYQRWKLKPCPAHSTYTLQVDRVTQDSYKRATATGLLRLHKPSSRKPNPMGCFLPHCMTEGAEQAPSLPPLTKTAPTCAVCREVSPCKIPHVAPYWQACDKKKPIVIVRTCAHQVQEAEGCLHPQTHAHHQAQQALGDVRRLRWAPRQNLPLLLLLLQILEDSTPHRLEPLTEKLMHMNWRDKSE
jgi:hypothetical protein